MSTKPAPWFEAWFVKLAAVVAGAALIYAAQLVYEHAARAEEARRYEEGLLKAGPLDFQAVAQVDLAGMSLDDRLHALESMVPGIHYLPLAENLSNVRALICLSVSADLEMLSAGAVSFRNEPPNNWSFELVARSGERVPLFPMPAPSGSFLCLRVPYVTAHSLESPTIEISRSGHPVASVPVQAIKALPERLKGPASRPPGLEVRLTGTDGLPSLKNSPPWPSSMLMPVVPPQYRVRLSHPPPPGETAFIKLVQTDCEVDHDSGDWIPMKNGEFVLDSPCGLLAKKAEFKVVEGVPSRIERTVTGDLGSVEVRFDQPSFIVDKAQTVYLTPTAKLTLPKQGNHLLRPPSHPKPALLVSAYSRRDWSVAPARIPDLVTHVDWVRPEPADLGLEVIRLPWGSVRSPAPPSRPLWSGPLRTTLRVSLITWRVSRRFIAVVPIR